MSAQPVTSAEFAVVGSVLQAPEQLAEIDLHATDFATTWLSEVWGCLLEMQNAGDVIDVITVGEAMDSRTRQRGWVGRLGALIRESIVTRNVKTYAEMVRGDAQTRRAIEIGQMLAHSARDEGSDAIDRAVRELIELTHTRRHYEFTSAEFVQAAAVAIDRANAGEDPPAVTTGLPELDFRLGGLHDGDLVIVAARPAMGKTAFLLNMAGAASLDAKRPVAVGIQSAEQPHEQIGARLLAINGRVAAQSLRTGRVRDEDWPKLTAAMSALSQAPIWLNDASNPHYGDVLRQARKWVHVNNVKVLYVDYIQRIRGARTQPIHEQVAEVCRSLKELARDLRIPVVALSQVSREVEKRNNKRPGMADLAYSSVIEAEADQVLTLYRDEVYTADTQDQGVCEINILKNRHGPTGLVRCEWLPKVMRFESMRAQRADELF